MWLDCESCHQASAVPRQRCSACGMLAPTICQARIGRAKSRLHTHCRSTKAIPTTPSVCGHLLLLRQCQPPHRLWCRRQRCHPPAPPPSPPLHHPPPAQPRPPLLLPPPSYPSAHLLPAAPLPPPCRCRRLPAPLCLCPSSRRHRPRQLSCRRPALLQPAPRSRCKPLPVRRHQRPTVPRPRRRLFPWPRRPPAHRPRRPTAHHPQPSLRRRHHPARCLTTPPRHPRRPPRWRSPLAAQAPLLALPAPSRWCQPLSRHPRWPTWARLATPPAAAAACQWWSSPLRLRAACCWCCCCWRAGVQHGVGCSAGALPQGE